MIRRPPVRSGFTLLEVMLASVIAVLLLAGLYSAFNIVLVRNDAAREEAARADLTRAIVNRMTLDLTAPIATLQPQSGGSGTPPATSSSSSSVTTTDATASTTTATTGTTTATTTTAPSTTSGTSTDTTSTDTTAAAVVNLPFNAGVIGSSNQVTLFVSRMPQGMTDPAASAVDAGGGATADLRRVSYYLGGSGGLCRQDRPWVTAAGVGDTSTPDTSAEAADLIAPEVTTALFEYFDGMSWLTDWDGSLPGADGVTLYGPPRAIRVTLTFEFPDATGGDPEQRKVVHVFPVRSADGLYVPPTTATDTTATTTTTMGGM